MKRNIEIIKTELYHCLTYFFVLTEFLTFQIDQWTCKVALYLCMATLPFSVLIDCSYYLKNDYDTPGTMLREFYRHISFSLQKTL